MDIQKLTKEQAVIITGFTGILCGSFSDFHADVEKRLGRGVQTFEMGMKSFMTDIKKLYEADFIEIATVCNQEERAKAQAVPEGFVLIKDDTKTVVAIERMVEQQVEASGMDSRRLERLDGWKIIEAAVKAKEPAND